MSAESLDELFAKTLADDYDSDAPWQAVNELRKMGSRDVFDHAAAWCGSQDPLKRARGADILAQIGRAVGKPNSFLQESFEVISRLAMHENESRPLASAIYALGHIENAQAIDILAEQRSHPDADVRFAVACALGRFAKNSLAASALIQLASDPDADVRDWATFAIGEFSGLDTPEVRDVLFRNLGDPDDEVRYEAIVGLAKRKDPRIVPALIEILREPDVSHTSLEAASAMLGREEVPDWEPEDFITALRDRFQ